MSSELESDRRTRARGWRLDVLFRISIVVKGLDGLLELIGGLLLLVVTPSALNGLAQTVFRHELVQDPDDFLATRVLHLTAGLSGTATLFGAVYLLAHGVVKVVLVWAVLRERLWAFPWMVAFLLVFIGYQAYQVVVHPGVGLILPTLFDVFVVWLTAIEYRKRRRPRTTSG